MTDWTTITLSIHGEGVSPDTVTWKQFSGLMDEFLAMLEVFSPGSTGAGVLPMRLKEGSLRTDIHARPAARRAVETIRRAETDRWSPRQVAAARRFHGVLARERWTVGVVRRGNKEVPFEPLPAPTWEVRQRCSFEADVQQVGGEDGTVMFAATRFDGPIFATVGQARAEELGAYLYRRVLVEGLRVSDLRTDRTVSFELATFRPVVPKGTPLEAMRRMRDLLGEDLRGLTAEAVMKELRGG